MAEVLCSEQAQFSLDTLPEPARSGLALRLDYLVTLPRMYPLTDDDRFPGCRTFWVDPCYRVFYMVAASGDDVYVAAVVEEDVDQTLMEL